MADSSNWSKQLIANAALAEFAEHGFAGARTKRIARRAGINKQLIYYYYGSKAQLFEEISKVAARKLSLEGPLPTSQASVTEKLRTHLKFLFDGIRARPDLAAVLIGGFRTDNPEASTSWGQETVRRVASTVSEGQGLGFFRDDIDPILAARQAVTLLVGYLALQHVIDPRGQSADRWLESASQLLLDLLTW